MNVSAKRQFLRDEFHGLTLGATMQRANVYPKGLSEAERAPLHGALRCALDELADQYAVVVDEAVHLSNIELLADRVSREHGLILQGGRFRIGPAQKALNLFLKYLWCADEIPIPPHCPFDQRIIAELPMKARCSWTVLNDMDGYQRLVDAARQLAAGTPLAEWELSVYNTVSVAGRRVTRRA